MAQNTACPPITSADFSTAQAGDVMEVNGVIVKLSRAPEWHDRNEVTKQYAAWSVGAHRWIKSRQVFSKTALRFYVRT